MRKNCNDQINGMEENAIREMENMTTEEQEELLTFWSGVGEFFKSIFNWVMKIFNKIVDLVKEGWRLAKDAMKKIFKPVVNFMKDIYNSLFN